MIEAATTLGPASKSSCVKVKDPLQHERNSHTQTHDSSQLHDGQQEMTDDNKGVAELSLASDVCFLQIL